MKNVLKRVSAVLLCVLIFASVARPFFKADAINTSSIEEDEEARKKLEQQLQSVRQRRNQISSQHGSESAAYENAYAEKVSLEANISLLQEEIYITENLISDYENVLDSLAEEMYEKNEEVYKLYEIYDQIVVYYYENRSVSELELIVNSNSIGEYLTKKDYVNSVLEYMNEIADKIDSAKLNLENSRVTYETSFSDLARYKTDLEIAKSECEAKYEELEKVIGELSGGLELSNKQLEAYEAEIKEYEQKIAELNRTIDEKYQYRESGFGWPIDSVYWNKCRVIDAFGWRDDPITHEDDYHTAIDISAPAGTPVQVVKSGKVTKSELSDTYGNVIVVTHPDGTSTMYAHLQKRLVLYGDTVVQGQIIGKVGNTGRCNGYHLHFAYMEGSEYKDPIKQLDDYFYNYFNKYGDPYNLLK